jgi:2-oxoglutarate ferredoxin oxidoreductase subunit delta
MVMGVKITLRKERCKGCNICVEFCPKKVLALDTLGKIHIVDEDKCVKCGQCELRCPDFAIRVNQGGQS